MTHEDAAPLLIGRRGAVGHIRLNRPKALNSLTMEMVRGIEAALDTFEADPALGVVLLTGGGERGLCAGGDIRVLYESGRSGDGHARDFLAAEYRLNARIARFAKPYVAVMDGITMGGGVGISAHGSNRIVTEATRLAMPETGIGFLPDIGATWLLSRRNNAIGTYIALTGEPIGGADAIHAGLADCLVAKDRLPPLFDALATLEPGTARGALQPVLASFTSATEPTPLQAKVASIEDALRAGTLSALLAALEADPSDFAQQTRKTILSKSPTSSALAFRLLALGRDSASLEACLDHEYAAATALLEGHDLYEGIRAAVIDKDRQPRWSPATLDGVDPDAIEALIASRSPSLFGSGNATPTDPKASETER